MMALYTDFDKGFLVNLSLGIKTNDGSSYAERAASLQGGYMLGNTTSFLLQATNPPLNVFVAAGNDNQPANFSSPANVPGVCTIGNINSTDFVYRGSTSFDFLNAGASNYGPVVRLFAPGTGILSTWPRNIVPDPNLNPSGVDGQFQNFTVGISCLNS
jgi:hypothetical protein